MEVLHQEQQAEKLYSKALEIQPEHAQAHYHLGALLTGTGIANYGAQHACGVNAAAAMAHFDAALPLAEAQVALDHCKAELKSADIWAERVRRIAAIDQHKKPASNKETSVKNKVETKLQKDPKWVQQVGGYKSIPRVAIQSAEQFWLQFVQPSRPAVITNFQDQFAPAAAWSWEALSAKFGDDLVHGKLLQHL